MTRRTATMHAKLHWIKNARVIPAAATHTPEVAFRFFRNFRLFRGSFFSDADEGYIRRTEERSKTFFEILRTYQFSDTDIDNMVSNWPEVVDLKLDYLRPKLEFFRSMDNAKKHSVKFLSAHPRILQRSLNDCIRPIYAKLSCIGVKDVSTVLRTSAHAFNSILERIKLIESRGLSNDTIAFLLDECPGVLMLNGEEIIQHFERASAYRSPTNCKKFVLAVDVFVGLSEDLFTKKKELFHQYGWSDAHSNRAFISFPKFMSYAHDKLEKTMIYLVREMELEATNISTFPRYFSYALDDRIKPRIIVAKTVEGQYEKKLVQSLKFLIPTEEKFIQQYIEPFLGKIPNLLEIKIPNLLEIYEAQLELGQIGKLLRIAIFHMSYIRDLFPNKYFNLNSVPAWDMKITKLMPKDAESCRLIDWMKKVSFSYSGSDSQEVSMNINSSGTKKGGTFKHNSTTKIIHIRY